MCNVENPYSVRSLVAVHIVNFQPDLLVTRFVCTALITLSTNKVDTVKVHTRVVRDVTSAKCIEFKAHTQGGPKFGIQYIVNPLTSNDPYRGHTTPLTPKRCILYIYSTNIGTEYFKHGIYSPFFSLFKMQFIS